MFYRPVHYINDSSAEKRKQKNKFLKGISGFPTLQTHPSSHMKISICKRLRGGKLIILPLKLSNKQSSLSLAQVQVGKSSHQTQLIETKWIKLQPAE